MTRRVTNVIYMSAEQWTAMSAGATLQLAERALARATATIGDLPPELGAALVDRGELIRQDVVALLQILEIIEATTS